MARQMHFGKTYQIEYENAPVHGSNGQDALYNIFRLFDVDTSAEDCYSDDYEVERESLVDFLEIINQRNETFVKYFKEREDKFNKYLADMQMSFDEFNSLIEKLIKESDPLNNYILISWW